MKKLKLKLGEGGMKGLLVQHAEKLVFGVIVLATLLILFGGYNHPGPDPGQSPDDLAQAVQQATDHINSDTWEAVAKERLPQPDNFSAQAREGDVAIDVASYAVPMPWDPLNFPLRAKRTDPDLLAVADLEVHAGFGPIAMKGAAAGPGIRIPARTTTGPRGLLQAAGPAPESAAARTLTESWRARIKGYRPSAGAEAKGYYFVAVTGLIPYKAQVQLYNEAFSDARGYSPERDTPKYIFFYVERAEVGADGRQSEWKRLNTTEARRLPDQWAGSPEELVDPATLDPSTAMSIPPVMLRDVSLWAMHSKIPRRSDAPPEELDTTPATESPPTDTDLPGNSDFPGAFAPETPPTSTSPDRARTSPDPAAPADSSAPPTYAAAVPHKLFRFYDFTVQPGVSYRYRVQLLLEDPNDPRDSSLAPNPQTLENSVVERLKKKPTAPGSSPVFWRETEWSEPSGIARTEGELQLLAAEVTAPRVVRIPQRNLAFDNPSDEPLAKLMVLRWDPQRAMDVAGEIEAHRGTTANFSREIEALQPVDLTLTKLDYTFSTDALLLDVRGGQELRGRNPRETIPSPGELLLLDAEGNLVVQRELDDQRTVRFHRYAAGTTPTASPTTPQNGRESPPADRGPVSGGLNAPGPGNPVVPLPPPSRTRDRRTR